MKTNPNPGSTAREVFAGADYSADEIEFLMAMDRYMRRHRRPFPTWTEALRVLRKLGYRKVVIPVLTLEDQRPPSE